MKQIHKTIILFFGLSSSILIYSQTIERINTIVNTTESTETKNDSNGIQYITTIKKDSIVGDSIFTTSTIKTTTRINGNLYRTHVNLINYSTIEI